MDYDYCRRSGQIPAFGDWDYSNEMPITQYFECARQAGLIRYSSSSGDSDPYIHGGSTTADLYAVDFRKPSRTTNNFNNAPPRKTRLTRRERRGGGGGGGSAQLKEQRKHGKVFDVTQPLPRKKQPHHVPLSHHFDDQTKFNNNKSHHCDDTAPPPPPPTTTTSRRRPPLRAPKAVDEDLYKIPPHLLHSSKRKKMPGFFSCLVPACAS